MKKDDFKLERTYEKAIKIFGKHLKIMRVILIALVGIVYTGFVYSETKTFTPLFFALLAFILLVFAILLMKKRILYIKDFCLECSSAGDVYITKLNGTCPKCKGEVRIKKGFLQCLNNKDHKWNLKEY